ncbi:hypothetical protein GA0074692_5009 [Micromonospora pallida]|uniref:Uncharacterized protein n=1 Tax=Micromonospora pallida TaxID=145854 RepID=A0A1C6TA34_9ACTN|nr:hypothetical protein GA0074692_5009 [Micromonospora pallida]
MTAHGDIRERVARAVATAQEAARAKAAQPRADRAYLVADAAHRYGLSDELAAQITGNGPAEIQREARRLAVERAEHGAADAAREAKPEAPSRPCALAWLRRIRACTTSIRPTSPSGYARSTNTHRCGPRDTSGGRFRTRPMSRKERPVDSPAPDPRERLAARRALNAAGWRCHAATMLGVGCGALTETAVRSARGPGHRPDRLGSPLRDLYRPAFPDQAAGLPRPDGGRDDLGGVGLTHPPTQRALGPMAALPG